MVWFLLNTSIDVRTGGRLHPVEVMMKRNAVNETRLQGSDRRTSAHTRSRESEVKKVHMKSTQEVAAAAAAICGQGNDCRNNAHLVMSILNAIQKNILSNTSKEAQLTL